MNRIEAVDHVEDPIQDPDAVNIEVLATTAFGRKTLQIIAQACELRYVNFKSVKQCLAAYEQFLINDGICRGKATALLVGAVSDNMDELMVDQICFQILHELSADCEIAINNNRVKKIVDKTFTKKHERASKQLEKTEDPEKVAELWRQKFNARRAHAQYSKYVREDREILHRHGVPSIPQELEKPFQAFSNKIQRLVRTEIRSRTKLQYRGSHDVSSIRVIKRLERTSKSLKAPISILLHMNPREDKRTGHTILAVFTPKNGTSMLFDSNYGFLEYPDATSLLTILEEDYAQEMPNGLFTLETYSR